MAITIETKDLKPILKAVGLGESPDMTPKDMSNQPPPPMPVGPPPPTPASAGYAAYASDPQNAAKVANSIVKPGQPVLPPNVGTAALTAGQIATHSPSDPSLPAPVTPQMTAPPPNLSTPTAYVSPRMATQQEWAAANPNDVATRTFRNHGSGVQGGIKNALDFVVPGLLGAAGGLHGDPGAGMNYVAGRVAQDRAVPQLNTDRYQAAVVQPAKEAAAIQDTQSQAAQRTAQENRANAQAQHLRDNPEKPGDPSKTVETGSGVMQFNPDTGRFDIRVGDAKEKATKADDQPLSNQAAHLNAVWDKVATKHGLPAGQFTPDMTRADAKELIQSYNNVLAAGRGDTHITIQQQSASTKNAALNDNDPAMQESQRAVANGTVKLQDVFGRGATTAQKAQFVAGVKAINPNFNSGDHDIENAVRRDFTSGHDSNTLNAINTAYKHLDVFANAAKALNGGNLKPINQLANEFGIQYQPDTSPQVIAGLVKEALKGEVSKAFTGAGATVDEQRNLDSSFSNANSLDTMMGVANTTKALLKGKGDTLKNKFQSGSQGNVNFATDGGGIQVGQTVKLKNGQTIKVKVVHPDGSFE